MSFGYFGTGQLSKYVPSGMCAKEVTSWWGNESIANSPQRHSPLPTAGKPQERSIPDFPLEEFIVVISVVSLLTNLSVLLNFTHSAELRSHVSGIFILNLSFSNILLTIINMPATFLWWLKDGSTSGTLSMAALVFPMSYSSKMRCKDAFVVVEFFWLDLLSFSICFFIGTFILCFSPCYNEVLSLLTKFLCQLFFFTCLKMLIIITLQ